MLIEGYWKGTRNRQRFYQEATRLFVGVAGSLDVAQVNGHRRLLGEVTHCLVQGDGLGSGLKHRA